MENVNSCKLCKSITKLNNKLTVNKDKHSNEKLIILYI